MVLGIRPENVQLSHEARDDGVPGVVYMTELLGRDILVDFRYGEQAVRALVPGDASVRVGQTVWLYMEPRADNTCLTPRRRYDCPTWTCRRMYTPRRHIRRKGHEIGRPDSAETAASVRTN